MSFQGHQNPSETNTDNRIQQTKIPMSITLSQSLLSNGSDRSPQGCKADGYICRLILRWASPACFSGTCIKYHTFNQVVSKIGCSGLSWICHRPPVLINYLSFETTFFAFLPLKVPCIRQSWSSSVHRGLQMIRNYAVQPKGNGAIVSSYYCIHEVGRH